MFWSTSHYFDQRLVDLRYQFPLLQPVCILTAELNGSTWAFFISHFPVIGVCHSTVGVCLYNNHNWNIQICPLPATIIIIDVFIQGFKTVTNLNFQLCFKKKNVNSKQWVHNLPVRLKCTKFCSPEKRKTNQFKAVSAQPSCQAKVH